MIKILLTCFLWVNGMEGKSLFKGDTPIDLNIKMRPLCANKSVTFCEEVDKYPTKRITELLHRQMFPVTELLTDESEGLDEPLEYILDGDSFLSFKTSKQNRKVRSTEKSADNSLLYRQKKCREKKKIVTPKLASNKQGEWKFIIQDDINIIQNITVNLCNEKEECQAHCQQFYSQVPMIALDSNGTTSKEVFWMPSSCYCMENA